MKILRILKLVLLSPCIILQIIPYGIVLSVANVASYHSYFDLSAWESGVIGPFYCAILSIAVFGMSIGSFFFKHASKGYIFAIEILCWLCAIFSLFPIFVDSYTFIGALISALLVSVAEISHLEYKSLSKK